jgi:hypothetical protein
MATPVRSDQDFGNVSRITNLPDPTAAQHPATKAYVDNIVEGLAWKDNVRAATTGNVNLSNPGTDTFDDIALSNGDRLLVRAQSTVPQNGLYIFNGSGVALTRSADASTFAELENAIVSVDEGTAYGASTWRQSEINGTIGSDDVVWESFGTAVPDASETVKGKVELASLVEADGDSGGDRVITSDVLNDWSGRLRRHAADVGDNSNTSFTITHNFNSRDVVVMVRENAGDYREAFVEKRINNVNSIDLVFASAPTSNQYRCIILR